jgi:hypothetical protein
MEKAVVGLKLFIFLISAGRGSGEVPPILNPAFNRYSNPIGKQDIFDLYAILYEPIEGRILDGSIRFDDPCIIAIARIDNAQPASEYTYVSIPFEYRQTVDPSKLITGKYYTTVVFSSSAEGGYFRGAIGSTLIIDEAKIELEDIENAEKHLN